MGLEGGVGATSDPGKERMSRTQDGRDDGQGGLVHELGIQGLTAEAAPIEVHVTLAGEAVRGFLDTSWTLS